MPYHCSGSAGTIAINGNGKQEALADEAEVGLFTTPALLYSPIVAKLLLSLSCFA